MPMAVAYTRLINLLLRLHRDNIILYIIGLYRLLRISRRPLPYKRQRQRGRLVPKKTEQLLLQASQAASAKRRSGEEDLVPSALALKSLSNK